MILDRIPFCREEVLYAFMKKKVEAFFIMIEAVFINQMPYQSVHFYSQVKTCKRKLMSSNKINVQSMT